MEDKFCEMPLLYEYKKSVEDYNKSLEGFIRNSGIRVLSENELVNSATFVDGGTIFSRDRILEFLKLLEDPVFLRTFFLSKGYECVKPRSIINKNGTTLFISAGVQILDKCIYDEDNIPMKKMWVAQPVFRTQYMNQISEGFSSSFVNLSALNVNLTIEDHFQSVTDWFEIMESLGFEKKNFSVQAMETKPRWGNKSFDESTLMIYYNGIEIGDANYIHNMPQKSRKYLSISDIGFGLERIKWVLGGGSYFDFAETEGIQTVDICKTMALLIGCGVEPSNSSHGYRLRQLSKKLISLTKDQHKIDSLVKFYYNFWKKWMYLTMPEIGTVSAIKRENIRNLKLGNDYVDSKK